MPIDYADYEALTVVELRDMADQLGVEIPSDARKADIIDALRTAAPKEQTQKEQTEAPETKSGTYEYQMNSTETATINSDEFWKIKLHS